MDLIDRESLLEKIQFRIEPQGVIGATVRDMVEKTREIILAEPTVTDNNVGSKWIPVTERLPEPGEYVLAWEWQGFCVVDRYIDIGDGRWGLSNDGAIYTHWMPLPSAPERTQEVQE